VLTGRHCGAARGWACSALSECWRETVTKGSITVKALEGGLSGTGCPVSVLRRRRKDLDFLYLIGLTVGSFRGWLED
jgi:hypothetical protein